MTTRMIKPKNVNFIPGKDKILTDAQLVTIDIDNLITNWLKYCRNQLGLNFTNTQIENMVATYSPEVMLTDWLEGQD